jgi:hypothetical protein
MCDHFTALLTHMFVTVMTSPDHFWRRRRISMDTGIIWFRYFHFSNTNTNKVYIQTSNIQTYKHQKQEPILKNIVMIHCRTEIECYSFWFVIVHNNCPWNTDLMANLLARVGSIHYWQMEKTKKWMLLQCSAVQCSTVQCSAVYGAGVCYSGTGRWCHKCDWLLPHTHSCIILCSAMQCSAVQCSAVQCEWSRTHPAEHNITGHCTESGATKAAMIV